MENRTLHPNVFVIMSQSLDDKIEAMKIFKSEIDEFPFPRSEKTILSLSAFRVSQSEFEASESFELVQERR